MGTSRSFGRLGDPASRWSWRRWGDVRGERSFGALALLVALVGAFLMVSGCAGTMEAAFDAPKSQGGKVAGLAAEPMAFAAQPVSQGSTVLRLAPAPAQVLVGDVAAVQIYLGNVENLYGIEVHLTFDKDIVRVEDDIPTQDNVQIELGNLPFPDFPVQNMVDNFGGRIDYAVVQLSPRPSASGSGVVATIHFRGLQQGTSAIHITHAKLASPDGFPIPVTLQDGVIVVSVVADVSPTPEPTTPPSSTATPQPIAPSDPTATPLSSTFTPTLAPPQATSCNIPFFVRSGDTAFSIARRFGISLDALATANGLTASYDLKIGQLLTIPGRPGPTSPTHVVQFNETLYSIAQRYGTTVETLAAINHMAHPWQIQPAQTLRICPP